MSPTLPNWRGAMAEKLSVDEALNRIRATVAPLPVQTLSIDANAYGCVTASPVAVAADTPRFDCAAMDGFAVRSAATASAALDAPAMFAIGGDAAAQSAPLALAPDTAIPISTGAAIPPGADAIAVRERCRMIDGILHIAAPVGAGLNIRRRGEDMRQGAVALPAGVRLSPEAIGALLAYGVTRISARRAPRIALIPTGSELMAPGFGAHDMRFDSNGPMIASTCHALGLDYRCEPPVPDDGTLLRKRLADASTSDAHDLILSTGGVSVGPHDLVRSVIESLGAEIIFHGVAMRPGKPMLFARFANGRPFFGLPGNPIACLVGFRFFVMAAIRQMLAMAPEAGAVIDAAVTARPGTTLFLRARQEGASARPLDDQRSHILSSLLQADCWLRADTLEGRAHVRRFPLRDTLDL